MLVSTTEFIVAMKTVSTGNKYCVELCRNGLQTRNKKGITPAYPDWPALLGSSFFPAPISATMLSGCSDMLFVVVREYVCAVHSVYFCERDKECLIAQGRGARQLMPEWMASNSSHRPHSSRVATENFGFPGTVCFPGKFPGKATLLLFPGPLVPSTRNWQGVPKLLNEDEERLHV